MLQDDDYIAFAEKNTVEVMTVSGLQAAIDGGEERAATYEHKDGQTYLVEWPNLTVEQLVGMDGKARSYNDTDAVPFTCVVDPHTLERMRVLEMGGGTKALMEEIEQDVKTLREAHGKGLSRKDYGKILRGFEKVTEQVEKGRFDRAIIAHKKATKDADEWPESLQARGEAALAAVKEAAENALADLELQVDADLTGSKRAITKLRPYLKGTGLEERAKTLLATIKTKIAEAKSKD